MIDYDKFQKSLRHLEEQYKNCLTLDQKAYLSEIDKEGIAESVIQRFETCYDTLWEMLKRHLKALALMGTFIADAIALHTTMTNPWD